MPRGSFLRQPVHSAAQLANQVRRDPVVAARYEKHYGIPATQFASYVQQHLGLRRLSKGGRYQVFFVRPDGSIHSQPRVLRRGTPVFLHLRTGEPVLLAECGNPMGTRLPGVVGAQAQATRGADPPRTPQPTVSEEEMPVSPAVVTAPDMGQATVASSELLAHLPVEAMGERLSVPDLPATQEGLGAYSAFASAIPLLLLSAGAVYSGGSGSLPSQRGTAPPVPPAVPEPSTLVLWAAAGTGILLARLRGRRAP